MPTCLARSERHAWYARGACDEKNSTPGMVYGLSFAKELGLLEGTSAWYFGTLNCMPML
jgi:acetylornithine deacetylase/succinyl-diaminopimelate desuccinylase-like protein